MRRITRNLTRYERAAAATLNGEGISYHTIGLRLGVRCTYNI